LDYYSGATWDVLVGEDGHLSVRVTDLVGDGWIDCLDALGMWAEYDRRGPSHDANRGLRAARTSRAVDRKAVLLCE